LISKSYWTNLKFLFQRSHRWSGIIKNRVDNMYKRKSFQGAAAGDGDGSRRAAMAGNLEVAGAGPRGAVLTRFEDKNIHKR